jgi:SEC-C motif domain protein
MALQQPCPCGTGETYDACCGRLHRGAARASTAEELMRSRYAAYAVGDTDYVFRTWHPRTRPDDLSPDPALTWTGLTILGSGPDWVEFVASYDRNGVPGELRERSGFEQRAGRWVYVAGDVGPSRT